MMACRCYHVIKYKNPEFGVDVLLICIFIVLMKICKKWMSQFNTPKTVTVETFVNVKNSRHVPDLMNISVDLRANPL